MTFRPYLYILAKISICCLVFVVAILVTSPVYAQSTKVTAKYSINLQLNSNLGGACTVTVDLQNVSNELIQNYNLTLPFDTVTTVSATKDDQPIAIATSQKTGETAFTIQLAGQAIRAGQTAQLKLKFNVSSLITKQYGLNQFYLPKLQTEYDITKFQLQLSYPADFPTISYVSDAKATKNDRTLILNSFTGFLVLWGDEAIYDVKENVPLKLSGNSNQESIFNFIPKLSDQDVVYKSVSGIDLAGSDSASNIWGIAQGNEKNVMYAARVHRLTAQHNQFDDQLQVHYHSVTTPAELQTLLSIPLTPLQKTKTIYDFVSTNYKPQTDKANMSRDQLADLDSLASQPNSKLNNLEYAAITAGLIQNEGVPVHVVYGYITTPLDLNGFNTKRPQVWLEVEVDNQTLVIDPYIQALTGFNCWNTTNVNRLQLGVWDPENDADSVLGILSSGLRPAPESTNLGEIPQAIQYAVAGKFPTQVLAGENYDGKIVIENKSGYFIKIKGLTLNGKDILDHIRLTDNLVQAAFPHTSTTIDVKYLLEQNLLEDRTVNNKVTLTPELELFPMQTFGYDITYSPNQKILIFIGTVAIAGITFLVVVLVYFGSKSLLRRKRH